MSRSDSESSPALVGLQVAADPAAFEAAGFAVDGARMRAGAVAIELAGAAAGRGILGWSLDGVGAQGLAGLPLASAPAPPPKRSHPNTTVSIDHVVVLCSELDRSVEAFEEQGVRCRRRREVGPPEARLRQAFFRLGEVIAELVEVPAERAGERGIRFWGITFTVADIDRAADLLGGRIGSVRDAVQPGRRIGTVRRSAGLGLPVALISPQPARR